MTGSPMNDRLFDELLRPVVDKFIEASEALARTPDIPDTTHGRVALLARINALQECGDRIARVLGVAEPLWQDMRDLSGLPW